MVKQKWTVKEYGVSNKKVVFLIGGWGNSQWMLYPASKILEMAGFYCITYALDKTILSADMKVTTRSITNVKERILHSITKLTKLGYEDFSVFGTSLGAMVGLLVADSSPQVAKMIFNIPGMDFAESIWNWDGPLSTFRSDVVARYHTYEMLKNEIESINTLNHFDKLQGKDLLFFLSTKDKIALSNPDTLQSAMELHSYTFRIVLNQSFGHLATGFFNLANAPLYLNFLRKTSL